MVDFISHILYKFRLFHNFILASSNNTHVCHKSYAKIQILTLIKQILKESAQILSADKSELITSHGRHEILLKLKLMFFNNKADHNQNTPRSLKHYAKSKFSLVTYRHFRF